MTDQTATPRTDAVTQRDATNPLSESGWRREYSRLKDCSERLERDLAAVTAERDSLKIQLDQMDDERLSWKREAELRAWEKEPQ